jgi:hypothetical protein
LNLIYEVVIDSVSVNTTVNEIYLRVIMGSEDISPLDILILLFTVTVRKNKKKILKIISNIFKNSDYEVIIRTFEKSINQLDEEKKKTLIKNVISFIHYSLYNISEFNKEIYGGLNMITMITIITIRKNEETQGELISILLSTLLKHESFDINPDISNNILLYLSSNEMDLEILSRYENLFEDYLYNCTKMFNFKIINTISKILINISVYKKNYSESLIILLRKFLYSGLENKSIIGVVLSEHLFSKFEQIENSSELLKVNEWINNIYDEKNRVITNYIVNLWRIDLNFYKKNDLVDEVYGKLEKVLMNYGLSIVNDEIFEIENKEIEIKEKENKEIENKEKEKNNNEIENIPNKEIEDEITIKNNNEIDEEIIIKINSEKYKKPKINKENKKIEITNTINEEEEIKKRKIIEINEPKRTPRNKKKKVDQDFVRFGDNGKIIEVVEKKLELLIPEEIVIEKISEDIVENISDNIIVENIPEEIIENEKVKDLVQEKKKESKKGKIKKK